MWTGLLTFFSGAGRWANKQAAVALAVAFAVLVVIIACTALFGAGKTSGGAGRDAAWLAKFNAANVLAAQKRARALEKQLAQEAAARQLTETALEAEQTQRATIAAELARLKDNPVIYTLEERRKLFRR